MGAIIPKNGLGSAALQSRHYPAITLLSKRDPSTVETFLNGLEAPVFLIDPAMKIICSNTGGQRLLAENTGFISRDGRLCTDSAASTGVLAEAVARVAQQGSPSWHAQQLRLRCSEKPDGFSLGLMRWTPGRDQAGLAGVHVLMIAYPVRQSLDQLEQFGLTTTEARVARDLIAGLRPKAIAVQQGRSLNTIRTHLARLMIKTETNRQFDLVQALTRGSRNHGAD